MNATSGSRPAVVLGAGLAGLATAAALRGGGKAVVVLERDVLPDSPAGRRGVPQGAQLHNMLTRAQRHLDELLPGYLDRLLDAGASSACVSGETHVHELGRRMPRRDVGLRLMSAPRPLIDHVALQCIREGGGVSVVEQAEVVGLGLKDGEVRGVRVKQNGRTTSLDTDLVVDCLGSASRVPAWLHDAGEAVPERKSVSPGQWYVSVRLRRSESLRGDPRYWLTFAMGVGPGALLSPLGPDHWYLSVSGGPLDPIPRNYGAMLEHLACLDDPSISDAVVSAQPEGVPHVYRKMTANWRRYDQLATMPTGLLCIGDSVAALNPLFGQGMSLAAWEAAELASMMADARSTDHRWLTDEHRRRVGVIVAQAWSLGEVVDQTARDLAADQGVELGDLVVASPEVHRCYVGLWHLIGQVDDLRSAVEQHLAETKLI